MNKKIKSIQYIKSLLLLFFGGMSIIAFSQNIPTVGKSTQYDLTGASSTILSFDAEEVNSAVSRRRKRTATVGFIKANLLKGNRR